MTENQMAEIKRHFNVVAEGMQHEIRLIAEGHDVLRREIQGTRRDLNEKFDLNTTLIKTVHDSLDRKIDAVDTKLTAKIDAVDANLTAKIDATRDELKADIASVGDKVDGHESRIQHLERRAA